MAYVCGSVAENYHHIFGVYCWFLFNTCNFLVFTARQHSLLCRALY